MKAFKTELQVRFGHVDPAGIVYFPRIFDYLHDVFEELWEEHVGQRYYHLLLEQHIGFPLVHCEVDFREPLRFGERPAVVVTCVGMGRSSLSLRYRIMKGERVAVDAVMVTACTDMKTGKATGIPEGFRSAFDVIKEAPQES